MEQYRRPGDDRDEEKEAQEGCTLGSNHFALEAPSDPRLLLFLHFPSSKYANIQE